MSELDDQLRELRRNAGLPDVREDGLKTLAESIKLRGAEEVHKFRREMGLPRDDDITQELKELAANANK